MSDKTKELINKYLDLAEETKGYEDGGVLEGSDLDGLGESWLEIAEEHESDLMKVYYVDRGFADACMALLEFSDGEFEVGVGEALRPYIELYQGKNKQEAHKAFRKKLAEWMEE